MTWTDRLAKILSKLPSLIKIDIKDPTVNIHISHDTTNNQQVTTNPATKSCEVNIANFNPKEVKELLKEFIDEDGILLLDKSKKGIEEFALEEQVPENAATINLLTKIVPPEDLNIWRAALYLRFCFLKKMLMAVTKIKFQIVQTHGAKGRNIANLCSAGYIEEWLIPTFNALRDTLGENEGKKAFLNIYSLIVNQMPFTIFVCQPMTPDNLRQEINDRKKYGLDFVNIHAIGEDNIKKVKPVIAAIEKDSYKEDQQGNIFFARISFKKSAPPT